MTTEELREIDKRIAVELGWKAEPYTMMCGVNKDIAVPVCQITRPDGSVESDALAGSVASAFNWIAGNYPYSSDPSAADLLRLEIERRGWGWSMLMATSCPSYIAEVHVIPRDKSTWLDPFDFSGDGDTPHIALCLAFLAACDATKEATA